MNNDIAISIRNLTKSYKLYKTNAERVKETFHPFRKKYHQVFDALNNISMVVRKGESIGIIGRNGSGKSTLLQVICGILTPTSGSVDVQGNVSALLELGAGFNPDFTGKENIYLNMSIFGFSKDEINAKYPTIIDFADIGDFINQPVRTYSSGMFVRLAFATAINVNPEILVIDEALAVGDIFFQQKCTSHMEKMMQACTILLVSHDMHSITNMCNRVIVLNEGSVVYCGSPSEGVAKYTKLIHSNQVKRRKKKLAAPTMPENITNCARELISDFDSWRPVEEDDIGGVGEIKILGASVTKDEGVLTTVKKGEKITVRLLVRSIKNKDRIIFGYTIKDRVGNAIFGENSLRLNNANLSLEEGYSVISYDFLWPEIYPDTYTMTVGIGEGTHPLTHLVQCWAHNIISFDAITPGVSVHGMFNNPLEQVSIAPFDTSAPI